MWVVRRLDDSFHRGFFKKVFCFRNTSLYIIQRLACIVRFRLPILCGCPCMLCGLCITIDNCRGVFSLGVFCVGIPACCYLGVPQEATLALVISSRSTLPTCCLRVSGVFSRGLSRPSPTNTPSQSIRPAISLCVVVVATLTAVASIG